MGVPVANPSGKQRDKGRKRWTQLETAVVFPAYLARHVTNQAVKDIYTLEVVDEPRVLGLALLQQVIFVE
jgi:hypothetical protein